MNKLQMAHEMALAIQGTKLIHDMELVSDMAWKYVDAMQSEADNREKEEAAQKRKEIREMLNAPNTFVEREGQHFDDVEWQPDWSQAPKGSDAWRMYGDGNCAWLVDIDGDFKWWAHAPSFDYQGNWEDSLRKRPQ